MTTLMTGGAGSVGSALVHVLGDRGRELRLLDNASLSSPRHLIDAPSFEFEGGDIGDIVDRFGEFAVPRYRTIEP